ncbi:hypothetical protein CHL78_000790 [Romboutsia weinsteinii]|uniref:Uncharacterized protein n=1 Tax=Romboutsia weinsteinii TaxID=2020949 RepID=A0A371JAE0_9FIRM|nr:hypothetical protein [Romboutsia weinsteinii]RDY29739.1 hypothetical protein CHL78_000790 [Romboutsia weinsteinii]
MINSNHSIKVSPIPWMKQKLEVLYDFNLHGNLYLIYSDLKKDLYNSNIDILYISNLLDYFNIVVDDQHLLYVYFPINISELTKNLILTFKNLSPENVYIILGGYSSDLDNLTKSNYLSSIYKDFPKLENIISESYLVHQSKTYEIFTSLSDTQRIFISSDSACTISGPTLNFHMKHSNPNHVNHISFVQLLDESQIGKSVDFYLRGLTNKNNNFNYNF